MDDLEHIFQAADKAGVRLALPNDYANTVRGDAVLFDAVQVPIVALTVFACISSRHGGERIRVLGARAGHTLMTAFPAFARVGRYLQWSIRVRTVAAHAVAFLEQSGLIVVTVANDRKATLSERGRRFLQKVRSGTDESNQLFQLLTTAAVRTQNEDLRLL